MKIAILINTLYKYRGMDSVAEQHAIELAKEGHNVTIFTFNHDHEIEGVTIEKLNWPRRDMVNFFYRLIYILDIRKNLIFSEKLKDFDIIIAHFYPMTYLAYFTKKKYPRIKYVFYNHGIGNSKYNITLRIVYVYILRLLNSIAISNADYIISISQFCQRSLKLKNKNIKKRVLYNQIDTGKFEYNRSEIKKDLFNICSGNDPKFLYVGILTHYKGIALLIKSFSKVIENYPDAKLFLVGKIPYGCNLYNVIGSEHSKNIFYLECISNTELGFLYDTCDVYVSASTWEGFNLPLVESQLFGKSVVAFDIGPHREVVKNGETGYLIKPFDTKKFADAMIDAYTNRITMGMKAKAWSFKFSTISNSDENITSILSKI